MNIQNKILQDGGPNQKYRRPNLLKKMNSYHKNIKVDFVMCLRRLFVFTM